MCAQLLPSTLRASGRVPWLMTRCVRNLQDAARRVAIGTPAASSVTPQLQCSVVLPALPFGVSALIFRSSVLRFCIARPIITRKASSWRVLLWMPPYTASAREEVFSVWECNTSVVLVSQPQMIVLFGDRASWQGLLFVRHISSLIDFWNFPRRRLLCPAHCC